MPDRQRSREGSPVRSDLAEAALDSGFALIRLAELQAKTGSEGSARRALVEAGNACSEAQRRLIGLTNGEARRFRREAQKLRAAIKSAHVRIRAPRTAEVIEISTARSAARLQ